MNNMHVAVCSENNKNLYHQQIDVDIACASNSQKKIYWTNTCTPHPNPTDKIADGADHDPSDLRATTRPVPILYVRTAPALATVSTARPFAPLRIDDGMDFSGFNLETYIFQNRKRFSALDDKYTSV
jgi:hypothetical protein